MTTASEILVVDDNPADSDLTREVLERILPLSSVRAVVNGLEAIHFLRREGKYANVMRTQFVMLDLNMPVRDGRAVLAEAKADPGLQKIPIVVFTTSQAASDVRKAYELGANCFVTKPGNLRDYRATVKAIAEFWLTSVVLPNEEEHE
jgi:two-component system, chemotaxis family, response regulator Rcp1